LRATSDLSLPPSTSVHLADAYDAIAEIYDGHVPNTAWMRTELRRHYLDVFRPGDHILDVGCGTGTEAVFMARHGLHVTAMDIAPLMIAETERKAAEFHVAERIDARIADLRELERWPAQGYDGIVSTFAALNMVNSLAAFSSSAARLLRPGAPMILHLSNRFSMLEYLHLLARGKAADARLLRTQGVRSFTMAGRPMLIYLSSPEETYSWFFEREFRLISAYALGVVRPHADPRWVPQPVLNGLGRIERAVRDREPFAGWGRFFVLELARRT
jgi:ubiquinone/menaquinone biosynthesis C-methylase UbiE